MESIKKEKLKTSRKKKPSFLSRLGHRISKAFTKTKSSNVEIRNEDVSKSCIEDLPATSQSHDNLKMKEEPYKTKRKKFRSFLRLQCLCFRKRQIRIPPNNDRCLSEGDLTRDENKFYSGDSSPKSQKGRKHNDSSENDTSLTDSHNITVSVHKRNFKNELALKLRSKNPAIPKKDEESDSSKTPDSPPRNCNGTSPTRPFNESRTPYSLSSLSHSSNSLLSGNVTGNYATSDGESMSRSIIDSTDDVGIVVDLTTPINKTTTASLLDSTAARQKIAVSRPRRARPKANDIGKSITGDKLKDSAGFSPVRESREILEEISEEDCQVPSNSPNILEDDSTVNLCLNNRINFSSEDQQSNDTPDITTPEPVTTDVPLQEKPTANINTSSEDSSLSNPPSASVKLPNEAGDSALKSELFGGSLSFKKKSFEPKDTPIPDTDDIITARLKMNKAKFEEQDKVSRPIINLRPTNASRFAPAIGDNGNEINKVVLKRTSWAPGSKVQIDTTHEIKFLDDKIENKIKVNRYVPLNLPNKQESTASIVNNKPNSETEPNHTSEIASNAEAESRDKRKSRVCDMIKNIENVSSSDVK